MESRVIDAETGDEVEALEVAAPSLPALGNQDIDRQIATARRYPRSVQKFVKEAEAMATLDEDTAGSMFYVLPRAGKNIEGPSVRLAEVALTSWGHARVDTRSFPDPDDDKFILGEATAFDLEKNVAVRIQVPRRITDSKGRRYQDDMIQTTRLAAMSIAKRQAIFGIIPQVFINAIFQKAKKVSIGKALSLEQSRAKAIDWYVKLGMTKDQVLKLVKKAAIEEIDVDDLITLRGISTAIQEGETTVAYIQKFLDAGDGEAASGATLDRLSSILRAQKTVTVEPKKAETTEGAPQTETPAPPGDSDVRMTLMKSTEALIARLPQARQVAAFREVFPGVLNPRDVISLDLAVLQDGLAKLESLVKTAERKAGPAQQQPLA